MALIYFRFSDLIHKGKQETRKQFGILEYIKQNKTIVSTQLIELINNKKLSG